MKHTFYIVIIIFVVKRADFLFIIVTLVDPPKYEPKGVVGEEFENLCNGLSML